MLLFPARVTTPDGARLEPVKVVALRDRMQVWALDDQRQPVLAADVAGELTGRGRTQTMATADGDWLIERAPGCGCGHPLRRFRVPQIADA